MASMMRILFSFVKVINHGGGSQTLPYINFKNDAFAFLVGAGLRPAPNYN